MKVTYIANEGFLLSFNGKKILIDSLFGKGQNLTYCDMPSQEVLEKMKSGLEPFDNIDIITASHVHEDHFDANLVLECLKKNEKTLFISTEQAVEKITKTSSNYEKIKKQVKIVTPDIYFDEWNESGINIKVLKLRHSPYNLKDEVTGKTFDKHENIENLGFIFEVAGIKVFHCGDANVLEESEFKRFSIDKENIDIAFLDCNIIPEGIEIIENLIKSKNIILMHIHPSERKYLNHLKDELSEEIPNTIILNNSLDSIDF